MKACVKKALICLLAALMLAGCKRMPLTINAPTATPKPQEPAMQVIASGSMTLPEVTVWENAGSMNAALAAFFGPLNESLEQALASGLEGEVAYRFAKGVERYYLRCELVTQEEKRYTLATVVITEDGEYQMPEPVRLEAYADGGYLRAKLVLQEMGITLEDTCYGEAASVRTVAQLVMDCAESVRGEAVDGTGIYLGEDPSYQDLLLQKAIKLGIATLDDAPLFLQDGAADGELLMRMVTEASKALEKEVFLRYGEDGDMEELSQMVDLCLMLMGDQTAEWQIQTTEGLLTRLDVARELVRHFEASYGTIDAQSYLSDTEDVDAAKADGRGLMSSFPGYGFFSPDYRPKQHDLYDIARDYAVAYHWGQNAAETAALTYRDLAVRIAAWLQPYIGRDKANLAVQTVDNGKSYEWYFNQLDGSPYQYVNCMPSISSMAIKWCYRNSDITPDSLRQRYLPEYQAGWYLWQVEECLDAYDVAYEIGYTFNGAEEEGSPEDYRHAIDTLINELDRGNIILTQMTEGDPAVSGHCMVIYGYIRFGSSILFMVNDSDYGWELNPYGEPAGEGALLDSNYALFIMRRQTQTYLSVSGPKQ